MVSELGLFQLSSFCALIGMTLGWRGVMTKFSGFYDLPTAWSQVFWGIVLGGVYAVMGDGLVCLGGKPSSPSAKTGQARRFATIERLGTRIGHRRHDGNGAYVSYV